MPDSLKYDAFISYRHLPFDKQVATKLQKRLEGYKPPKALRGEGFTRLRIFRDETELSTSNSLSESIREALRNTWYLVVICSAGTAESRWCMEEISYFKELHGGSTENIRVIVIEGDPHEVMPSELLQEQREVQAADGGTRTETVEVEPLALNIVADTHNKALKKLDGEYLRIAATLLGFGYEDLYRRNQRRRLRNTMVLGGSIGALLVGIIIYGSVLLLYARQQEQLALDNLDLANQQKSIAEQNLAEARSLLVSGALDYAAELNAGGARTRAAAILAFLYGHIEQEWDNYDELMVKFRDVAMGAVYYDANSLYAYVEGEDSVLDVFFLPGEAEAVLVTARRISVVEAATGKVVRELHPPGGAQFTSCAPVGETLLCGLDDGGILAAGPGGGEGELFAGVCTGAVERIAYREQQDLVLLLGSERDMAENTEYLYLQIVPLQGGAFATALEGAQTFTLESDVRGDLSCRYSFSENGRFLAAKKNVSITVEGGERLYDTDNKDVLVLDTDAFDAARSQAENQAAMLRRVDATFDLDDVYLTARYHIDNDGLLFLDLQTALYDGTRELGYMTGYTLPDKRHLQQIAVYDTVAGELVLNRALLEEGEAVYSSFVPMPDSLGLLAYVRYDGEEDASSFEVYDLYGEEIPEFTKDLPAGVRGSQMLGVAVAPETEYGRPQFALAVNTSEGSRVFVLRNFWDLGDLVEYKGYCETLTASGREAGVLLAGFSDGMLHCYTLQDSLQALDESPADTPYVNHYGDIFLGAEDSGNTLDYSGAATVSVIEYSADRTRLFGFVGSGKEDDEEEADSGGFYIWDLQTGDISERLDFLGDSFYTGEVAVNEDLSVAVVRKQSYWPQYQEQYTFWDLESGRVAHEYVTTKKYDYFGLGRTGRELWFVVAETGVVETINTETGLVEKREFIRNMDVGTTGEKLYYNPDNDYIVLVRRSGLQAGNYVYSFASQQMVFDYLDIVSVNRDCTVLYLDGTGQPISLQPQDLYQQLLELPYLTEVFEGDETAVGVGIL